jgi:hypothetical protein
VAERRVPGVVVLGGDVHAHVVAELKADFDDPRAPVLASEFCGTSISSRGRDQRCWTPIIAVTAARSLPWCCAATWPRAACAARKRIPGLNAFVLYFALPCMLFRFGMNTPICSTC